MIIRAEREFEINVETTLGQFKRIIKNLVEKAPKYGVLVIKDAMIKPTGQSYCESVYHDGKLIKQYTERPETDFGDDLVSSEIHITETCIKYIEYGLTVDIDMTENLAENNIKIIDIDKKVRSIIELINTDGHIWG